MTVVDLSHYQNPTQIDYEKLRSEIAGAYMKVTQGTTTTDITWAQHYAGLAGTPRGCYHYAGQGVALGDPTQEAQHFASLYRQAPWELRPTLDIETGAPTPAWVKTFVAAFRAAAGVQQMRIYMPESFAITHLVPAEWIDADLDLWIARYNTTLGWDHPSLVLWQFTSSGSLPGYGGKVDLSHEMHSWSPILDGGDVMANGLPEVPDYTKEPPTLMDFVTALGWATAHAGMAWENTNLILQRLSALEASIEGLKKP